MKKTLSLLLALAMALSLIACGQNETPAQDEASATQTEQAPAVEPAAEPEPVAINLSQADEWVRAQALGFAAADAEKTASVTYAQFMMMLDRAVERIDADKLAAWQERFPEARQLQDVIDRGNAALAIFAAAETLGGEVYARNLSDEGQDIHFSDFTPTSDWGDVERVPVGFEAVYGYIAEFRFVDWAMRYVAFRGSVLTGKPLFYYEDINNIRYSAGITMEEAVLACLRFYESAIVITEREPTAEDAALLAAAEAKKQAISNSETDVTYTGTAYYVSNGGSDENDGKAPETAWATIGKVVSAGTDGMLQPGDAVFFERGGLWRGEVLNCAEGVTYSAYGTGAKPRIYGSEENYSGAEKWELWYDENGVKIWKLYRDVSEVGNIVFNDGESYATREYAYYNGSEWVASGQDRRPFDIVEHLNEDLTFYSTFELSAAQYNAYARGFNGTVGADTINTVGPVYLRCDVGNPGELYEEIEFHQSPDGIGYVGLVNPAGNNVIDNLCIQYSVRNGIAIYGEGRENAGNGGNTIQNCVVAWAGGDQHDLNRADGGVMVCGECIVWKTDDNHFLNNYVAQACAAGFVSEFVVNEFISKVTCIGTVISGNVIEKCQDTFWFWDNGGSVEHPELLFWDGTTITDNYVLYMGYGWSGDARFLYGEDDPTNTYHKYGESWSFGIGGGSFTGVRNMTVSNNVFYLTAGGELITHSIYGDWDGLVFHGNTYVENDNRNILRDPNFQNKVWTVEQIKAYLNEWLGDDAAVVFAPSVKLD